MELLVVLLVLGLVAAVGAPSLRDVSGERALSRAASETTALLRAARTEALLSGSDAVVSVDLDKNIIFGNWNEEQVELPPDLSAAVLTAREELLLTGKPAFRFFADGSATGGALRLRSQDAEWLVSVDWLTGRVDRSRTSP